ncbi:MAG: hypothetical protein LBL75_02995 [Rickettsiales bacterium]|jgi:hypothetical protein|nr:hypothetical protein [Rickettsiales bacterium]
MIDTLLGRESAKYKTYTGSEYYDLLIKSYTLAETPIFQELGKYYYKITNFDTYKKFQDDIINSYAMDTVDFRILSLQYIIVRNNLKKMDCYNDIMDRNNESYKILSAMGGFGAGIYAGLNLPVIANNVYSHVFHGLLVYVGVSCSLFYGACWLINKVRPPLDYTSKADNIKPAYSKKIFNDMCGLYPKTMEQAGIIAKLK